MRIERTVFNWALRSLYVSSLAVLGLNGCAQQADGGTAGQAASGPAGTLHFSGVVNGSATIQTANCSNYPSAQMGLATMTAPADDSNSDAAPAGAVIQLVFTAAGATIHFTANAPNNTEASTFIRGKSNQGISWDKVDGHWKVTFNNAELYNVDILHRKTVVLSGSLICTHSLN